MNDCTYDLKEDPLGFGLMLNLRSKWHPSVGDVMRKNRVRILNASAYLGWEDTEITFLNEIQGLRGLYIVTDKKIDVSPLIGHSLLENLGIWCPTKGDLDFNGFPALRYLAFEWAVGLESILALRRLDFLSLDNYPYADFTRWNGGMALGGMQISSRRLVSLEGVEKFSHMRKLKLHCCPRLQSLEPLRCLRELEEFSMFRCKLIRDLSPLKGLGSLRKVELEDCGALESLTPLATSRELEYLQVAGSTIILDGDFSPLLDLPKLKMALIGRRKHYSHLGSQLSRTTS